METHIYTLHLPTTTWYAIQHSTLAKATATRQKRLSAKDFILAAIDAKLTAEKAPSGGQVVEEGAEIAEMQGVPAKPVFVSKFNPHGAGLGPHNLIEEREKFVALHGDPGDGWRLPDRQRFMMKNYPHYVERLAKLEGEAEVVEDAPSPVVEPAPVKGDWM